MGSGVVTRARSMSPAPIFSREAPPTQGFWRTLKSVHVTIIRASSLLDRGQSDG
jgi:hypothetical protein